MNEKNLSLTAAIEPGISSNTENEPEPDLESENQRLRLELACAELGVKKECRNDVIRLSEGGNIEDVIKKYPVFLENNHRMDTGVFSGGNSGGYSDASLRKAFGL